MSATKQLVEDKRVKSSNSKKKTGSTSNFLSFQPTRAEKEEMKTTPLSWEEIQDTLLSWLERGFVLSLKYEEARDVYLSYLRSPSENWQDALYLTTRHVDLSRSLMSLCYALRGKFSDYEQWLIVPSDDDVDW